MSTDPLADARSKIERAETNIQDVDSLIREFFANPPPHYRVFRQLNVDGSRELLKVEIIREPPRKIAAAIGDVVTNLRSALDFMLCEIAIKSGQNDLFNIEFPFASSPEEFRLPKIQKKIQKLPAEAIALVADQRPYKGGNNLLWAMNVMRRSNVHRHLIVSALTINHADGRATLRFPNEGVHNIGGLVPWQPADRQITVLDFTPNAKLEYDLKVGMGITVRKVEPIEGQPIVGVLQQFCGLTSRILDTFEERFFR